MDELDLLALLRTEAEPAPDVVIRQREQLQAAIEAAGALPVSVPQPRLETGADAMTTPGTATTVTSTPLWRAPGGPERRRRGWLAAAAAAVVLAGASGLLLRSSGDDGSQTVLGGADATTREPSPGPLAAAPACGSELPVDLAVPEGYSGPSVGPGPDAVAPPEHGQLAVHWTSADSSIEARWPAPADLRILGVGSTGTSVATTLNQAPELVSSGRWATVLGISSTRLGERACSTIAITATHLDPAAAVTTINQIDAALFAPGTVLGGPVVALVVGAAAADSAPPAVPCDAPAGIEAPNRGGEVVPSDGYDTARAALNAFLGAVPTLPPTGYLELTLPDGSIAYAHPGFGETSVERYVAVIHVAERGTGWSVVDWDASGC